METEVTGAEDGGLEGLEAALEIGVLPAEILSWRAGCFKSGVVVLHFGIRVREFRRRWDANADNHCKFEE